MSNICECGHEACYHVHEITAHQDQLPSAETSSPPNGTNALLDRIKRLEETVQSEREIRDNALARERQLWEREVLVLREALVPFYKSEQDMRRKLVELEDRIEGNYDEHVRLKERVVALDDANMALERRVEDVEGSRSKRRRVGRPALSDDSTTPNGHVSPQLVRASPNTDDRSVHSTSSRALSPNGVVSPLVEREEPRSSGILNLVELPRTTQFILPPRRSPALEEPRSSGFLALDLAERLSSRRDGQPLPPPPPPQQPPPPTADGAPHSTPPLMQEHRSPPVYARSNPEISPETRPPSDPPFTHHPKSQANNVVVLPVNMSPRKRKYSVEHRALEVLADVSVASPLIH